MHATKEEGSWMGVQMQTWTEMVLCNFESQDAEFQNLCYEGRVEPCLELFFEKTGIKVGVFDCSTPDK